MRQDMISLMELQECELILHESAILHDRKAANPEREALETRCRQIRAGISLETLRRYDKLRTVGLGIVREVNGFCNACRLNITIGDLNRMRTGKMTTECPNCGLFLLLSDSNKPA